MAHKALKFLWLLLWSSQIVYSQSLSVNTLQELDFGDSIFPGVENNIPYTDSNAAYFEITGEPLKEVIILFQIPAGLEDQGGNILDVYFSSSDAGYNTVSADPMNAIAFNPGTGTTTNLNSDGKLYIWVGATVIPQHTQAGNNYQAPLVLDINYTN